MRYRELADLYEKLEGTAKKLEKRDKLADFYKRCREEELYSIVLLSMGEVFPSGEQDLGIAREMIRRVLAKALGVSGDDVLKKFKETGDLGLTAEFFIKAKKQATLAKKELTVEKVFENLRRLPEISGAGSQDRKISLVSELLISASSKEAKYIVRTVLGDMRIGVAAGIVRDAIAIAFEKDAKEVESSFDVTGDYGEVARMAKKGKFTAEVELFRPVRVMLADRAKDLKEALEKFEEPAIEWKYDGFRIAAHKDGNKIKIFSRRLDNVTNQFPDIVSYVKENVNAKKCIIEGEALAIDPKGNPLPFQSLSRRIQRKYDIEKMVREIPVQVNLFDLIYFNGSWMEKPLKERWKKLKEITREAKNFRLA
ncbi:MAG: ATP-dependent DNA ligase, partial [Candidatus Aenigmarchaeota archaeon]|nr:ATP-dependent DNA ligase [Candidatus Aenigmarchaeota archaeon]MDI6722255.1 ATP-dependent DNA ligase [Candidatus Aenigmarchaeota archaeon]